MASGRRGIEHRNIDGVLNAYEIIGKPRFAIFSGQEIIFPYEGTDVDDAKAELGDMLEALRQGGSGTVFTLRIYPDSAGEITAKNKNYCASTTFMLQDNVPTKMENGIMVVDRGVGNTGAAGNTAMTQRLDKLEAENKALLERLHKQELQAMEERLQRQIGALSQQPEEKPWEKWLNKLAENPEALGNIMTPVKGLIVDIASVFVKGPKKNYIINSQTQSVAGTEHTQEDNTMADTHQEQLTDEQVEALHDEQDGYLEKIEARIGVGTLTALIKKVSELDDKSLNKLLNYLD